MAADRTCEMLLLLPPLLLLLLVAPGPGAALHTEQFSLLMPKVLPPKPETYFCTSVRLLDDKDQYILSFEPNGTANTAHHMLLYGCENPGTDDVVWNCGDMAVSDPGKKTGPICRGTSQVIYAWAKNAPKLVLPKGVAFHVGKSTSLKYLTLQVHYADVTPFKDGKTDDSGVFLTYTETPQPKAAGVLLLGTAGFIFPKQVDYMETACDIEEDKVIHPFAFRTHTHELGEVVSGWKVQYKNGKYEWTLIGKMNPQLPQMFYPVLDDITLRKGDIVAARCTMNNYRSRITKVGPTSADEMCNAYIMYWAEESSLLEKRVCFTLGPPYYYWNANNQRQLSNIPTLKEASEITNDEIQRYMKL